MDGWMDVGMDCGAFYEGDKNLSMGSVVRGVGGGGGGGEGQVGGHQCHDRVFCG